MTKISKKLILTLTLVLVAFNILNINKIDGLDNKGFNILIINSYHQGHHWESDVLEGINKYIGQYDDINVNVEYLDFRNKKDEEYITYFRQLINKKYPQGSIDVLYTVDDEAYEVFYNEGKSIEKKDYSVGLYSRDDNLNILNLIHRLTPDIKTINVITEDSKYGEAIQLELNLLVEKYYGDYVELRYVKSNYIQDVLTQLEELDYQENSVNIIAGEFQNKNSEKYMDPSETINNIKKYIDGPIYSNDPTYIDAGILGGHIDIGIEHGAIVGQMLIKIKDGIDVSSIENEIEPIANAYVDYNGIYEYDINPFDIGNDITIINKGLFDLVVPNYIKVILCVLATLVVLVTIIIFNYLIKYRKEIILQKREREKSIEREKLKTDFIVNLSHELRTPINIILGTSRVIEILLKKDTIDKKNITDKLNNINQNSYRLLKISNNIIDITKVEEGMFKLNLENSNIVDIIENTFTSTINVAKAKNINMVFDTEEEEIITSIDVVQIKRVLLNLLSNAIKFTDENGEIYVGVKQISDNVVIEVKDNGIGIENNNIKNIFDRFYQVDSILTRKTEGSGIGLCIVQDIVRMHYGEIEVESEINEGSVFKVKIPIRLIDEETEFNKSKFVEVNKIADVELSDI